MFIESLMKKKSSYMVTDLSDGMLESTTKLIKDGNFCHNPKNKLIPLEK